MPPIPDGRIIVALLFGAVLGTLIIGPLIGAVSLRAAAKSYENLTFTFWSAQLTALSAFLLSFVILFAIRITVGGALIRALIPGLDALGLFNVYVAWLIRLLTILGVGFPVHAGVISIRHDLPFSKGLKLAGFVLFPSLLVAGVMVFLVLVAFRQS